MCNVCHQALIQTCVIITNIHGLLNCEKYSPLRGFCLPCENFSQTNKSWFDVVYKKSLSFSSFFSFFHSLWSFSYFQSFTVYIYIQKRYYQWMDMIFVSVLPIPSCLVSSEHGLWHSIWWTRCKWQDTCNLFDKIFYVICNFDSLTHKYVYMMDLKGIFLANVNQKFDRGYIWINLSPNKCNAIFCDNDLFLQICFFI